MTTYVTKGEIRFLWKTSLNIMIAECRINKKVPEGLIELIKHNLYVKYVCYNPATDSIEIGVNESMQRTATYPIIKVYQFPLNEVEDRLKDSYQTKRGDLEFYAKIFKGKSSENRMFVL
ncbi:hypothetical protein [Salinimicrobium terrae]|uniref:hypothetical protein n=1 Tax=Salinimicrobium terrae TaxID=470866 RepID=UPI00048B5AF9|nr:hypothetical protein [Salinimicrobium terrae]